MRYFLTTYFLISMRNNEIPSHLNDIVVIIMRSLIILHNNEIPTHNSEITTHNYS